MPEQRPASPRVTEKERHYRDLFAEHASSGKPLREFAAGRGIPPGTLSWWKSEIRRREARRAGRPLPKERRHRRKVPLVPVTVTDEVASVAARDVFEVALPGGAAVRVPPRFDADSLRLLVTMLIETC